MTQAVAQAMAAGKTKNGAIVNISSIAGKVRPHSKNISSHALYALSALLFWFINYFISIVIQHEGQVSLNSF